MVLPRISSRALLLLVNVAWLCAPIYGFAILDLNRFSWSEVQ